ncbi:hypothetical protein HAX54_031833, partial [Datura stramonium]|nr:hypothetical protein [Datura stramonium]
MSDRKRQMIDSQIEKNLKCCIAYKEMPPEQKEELLQHHRQQYAARKHAISKKFHASTSNQPDASSEPQIVISEQTTFSIQDNPSTSRNGYENMAQTLDIQAITPELPDWTCKIQVVDICKPGEIKERKIKYLNMIFQDEQ